MHHDTSVDMNGVRVNGMKEQEQRLRRMEIQFGRARLVPRPWELFGHQVSIVPRDSDPDLDPGRDLSISLDLNPSPVILRSNGANDDQESGLFSPGSDLADDESGDVFGASPSPCRLSPVTLMPSQYLRTDVSEGLCSDLDPSSSPTQLSPICEECSTCPPSASSELDECFGPWGDRGSGVVGDGDAHTVSISSSGYNSAVGTSSDSLLQDGDAGLIRGVYSPDSLLEDRLWKAAGHNGHSTDHDHSYDMELGENVEHDTVKHTGSTQDTPACETPLLVETEDLLGLSEDETRRSGMGSGTDSLLEHTDSALTDVSQEFDSVDPAAPDDTCSVRNDEANWGLTEKRAAFLHRRFPVDSVDSGDKSDVVFSGGVSPEVSGGSQDSFERNEKAIEMESADSFDVGKDVENGVQRHEKALQMEFSDSFDFSKDVENIITALDDSDSDIGRETISDKEKDARSETPEDNNVGAGEVVGDFTTSIDKQGAAFDQDVDTESASGHTESDQTLLTEDNSLTSEDTQNVPDRCEPVRETPSSVLEGTYKSVDSHSDRSESPAGTVSTDSEPSSPVIGGKRKSFSEEGEEKPETFVESSKTFQPVADSVDSRVKGFTQSHVVQSHVMESNTSSASGDDGEGVPENVQSSQLSASFDRSVLDISSSHTNSVSGSESGSRSERSSKPLGLLKTRTLPLVLTQDIPERNVVEVDRNDVEDGCARDAFTDRCSTVSSSQLDQRVDPDIDVAVTTDAVLYENRDLTSSALYSLSSFDEDVDDVTKNDGHVVSTYTYVGDAFCTAPDVHAYDESIDRTSGIIEHFADKVYPEQSAELDDALPQSSGDDSEGRLVCHTSDITNHEPAPLMLANQSSIAAAETTDSGRDDPRQYTRIAQDNVYRVSTGPSVSPPPKYVDTKPDNVTDLVCDRDGKYLPQNEPVMSVIPSKIVKKIETGTPKTETRKETELPVALDDIVDMDRKRMDLNALDSCHREDSERSFDVVAPDSGRDVSDMDLWAMNSPSVSSITSDVGHIPASVVNVRTKTVVESTNSSTTRSTMCVLPSFTVSTAATSITTTPTAPSLTAPTITITSITSTTTTPDLTVPAHMPAKASTTKKVLPTGRARRGHTNSISHLLDKWSAMELTTTTTSSSSRTPQRPSSSLKFSRQLSKSTSSLASGNTDWTSLHIVGSSSVADDANRADRRSAPPMKHTADDVNRTDKRPAVPTKQTAEVRNAVSAKDREERKDRKIVLVEKTLPVVHVHANSLEHQRDTGTWREGAADDGGQKTSVAGLPSVHSLVEKFSHSDTESSASSSPLSERKHHQAVETPPHRQAFRRTEPSREECKAPRTNLVDATVYRPPSSPIRQRTSSLNLHTRTPPATLESQANASVASSTPSSLNDRSASDRQHLETPDTNPTSLAETRMYWLSLQQKAASSSVSPAPRNRASSLVKLGSSSSSSLSSSAAGASLKQDWVSSIASPLPSAHRRVSLSSVAWHLQVSYRSSSYIALSPSSPDPTPPVTTSQETSSPSETSSTSSSALSSLNASSTTHTSSSTPTVSTSTPTPSSPSPSTQRTPQKTHVGRSVALLRLSRGQPVHQPARPREEEARQDGRTLYKTREEQSFTESRVDGQPPRHLADSGIGGSGLMREDYGVATSGGGVENTQREDFHFSEMSSVKSQFERGPQESTPQRRPIDIRQEVSHTEGGVYESQPTTFEPQYEDEPEEGVYENEPRQRSDVARESDRNIGAELPSVGTAKNIREKFLTGQVERSSGIKREATPPDVIDGGVFENQPQYNPDVVHAGEQQQEQLPEQGYARNIAGRFKQLEKQGSVPTPSQGKREITPDRTGKVEYVSEPRGHVEKYEGHAEAGVFESQPQERPDVVKSDMLAEEVLPERGTAKNVAQRFKQMSSGTPSPAPRGKREITPDTSGRVEFVSEPRGHVETYEGRAESGVFESQPADREGVVKSDQLPEEILPERGAARNIAAKFREMEKTTKSPPSPGKYKEFTPPRENGTAGVYESNPTRAADVVTSEEAPEEILPERGTAKNLVNRFRQLSSSENTPAKSPRAKKEFTPPPSDGVVFENTPKQFIPDYNRPAESGILESQPEVRQDVVKGDEPPKYEEELPERGFTRSLVSAWKQRESESAKISPTASGKPKEFTPPREEPRVVQQRGPRTPKSPAAGAGLSDGSVHPMDLPGQYQPQEQATVFESEPEQLEGVAREEETDWMAGMPKANTTKKMLDKFRNIQAEASKESPRPQPTGRKASGDSNSSESTPEQVVRSKSMRVAVQLEKCGACGKTVYAMEKIEIEKNAYHKSCFRCSHCHCVLTPKTFAVNNHVMFCTNHYKQLFATKGNYDEGFGRDQHKKRWKSESNLADGHSENDTSPTQQ